MTDTVVARRVGSWSAAVPRPLDLLLGLAITAFAQLELGLLGEAGPQPRTQQVLYALAITLPVAWRNVWPVPVLLVVSAAFGSKGLVMHPLPEVLGEALAYLLANYTVAARCQGRWLWTAWAAATALGELRLMGSNAVSVGENVIDVGFNAAMWVVGRTVRTLEHRAVTSEQQVRIIEEWAGETSREAVTEERARIARELHDIVSHNIGVIVLHAQGGRRQLDDDVEQARSAFSTIEQSGRQALDEMRRLLDVLRQEGSPLVPQPTLADLDGLVARVRTTGLDVQVRVDGDSVALSPGLDLCAYRVVQEALTNVVRHAQARTARVQVSYGTTLLSVAVTDDGRGPAATMNGGHGIVGMRERVALFGGTMQAGAASTGGFAVLAAFPLGAS